MIEGILNKINQYIKSNSIKLSDNIPIFSARYHMSKILKIEETLDNMVFEFEKNLTDDTLENRMVLSRVKDFRTLLFGKKK